MARGFPQTSGLRGAPRRVAPGFLKPSGPEVPLCRVAPGFPSPVGSRCSFCRGLGISLDQMARGYPHCRVAQSFLFTDGSGFLLARGLESPFAGWLGVSPSPLAPGFPPLPVARVSPSPVTVPGGEEISTPVRAGRTRGCRHQFQDSLAVHKPSTVNPELSPATDVSPPNPPQPGPQAGEAATLQDRAARGGRAPGETVQGVPREGRAPGRRRLRRTSTVSREPGSGRRT